MEKKISYLNRDFNDYKKALIDFSKKYYPDLAYHFSEASVDSWLIDLNASIADNLSYHIDRVFQETDIDSAQKKESVFSIARSNGVKIPGPKGAMAEVKFTCQLPIGKKNSNDTMHNVDMSYAPLIKRGTIVSSSDQVFELMEDVDFSSQFNSNGISDRTIVPVRNSNNNIIRYQLTKLGMVTAGESRIFSKQILDSDVKPFMEIEISGPNVMNVESIIVKNGDKFLCDPSIGEFFTNEEEPEPNVKRFFEVDYLAQQTRWGDASYEGKPVKREFSYHIAEGENDIPIYSIVKGEWKPVKNKFITEHTEDGGIKITFGSGMERNVDSVNLEGASDFAKYQITKMLRNEGLGMLPEAGSMLYVLYRVGGGLASNVPKGAINNISYLDVEIGNTVGADKGIASSVRGTITVENTTPSVSGKDAPSIEEMRNIVKYAGSAQERCVTIKDYKSRIMMMPPRYGSPYRIGVIEENNKIMIYLLGLDHNGHLTSEIPDAVIRNISEYLSNYRMINDFVEIKSGKVVNVSFEITVHTDKNYNSSDIKDNIANMIKEYMDSSNHEMGDDIYVGDIFKEVSKIDGVVNTVDIQVYNEIGNGYSSNQISQSVYNEVHEEDRYRVNLEDSENILYSDGDTMLEIKNPVLGGDIKIVTKPI